MRKLLFNLHLAVGLIAGVFVCILGLTGSIMAFETELDDLFHAKWTIVKPGPAFMNLREISATVLRKFPGEHISGFTLATRPDRSFRVKLRQDTAFVNPYTGEILGVQTSTDRVTTILNQIHQLHLRLLITDKADTGKKIVGWAAVAMLFLIISGVYLWWPRKRVAIQARGLSGRAWFDIHNAVGIFSFVFLLALTLTGLVIAFEKTTGPLLYRLTSSEPSPSPEPSSKGGPGGGPITPDKAVEIARTVLPGSLPFNVNVPAPGATYQIRSRFPEDRTPGGRSKVIVDQYTGKVLFAEGSRTAPAGRRLEILNRAIHTGDIFGIPSKIIASLASLMAVVQFVSGIAMWRHRDRRISSTPASGTAIEQEETERTEGGK